MTSPLWPGMVLIWCLNDGWIDTLTPVGLTRNRPDRCGGDHALLGARCELDSRLELFAAVSRARRGDRLHERDPALVHAVQS